MTGTTFNAGQLAELSRHVNVAAATVLPRVAERLDPKSTLNALAGKTEVFAGHLEIALKEAIGRMLALIPHEPIELTISELRDPDTYFQTRAGLWIYKDFRDLIVAKAAPVSAGMAFKINVDELGEHLDDERIEAGLSKGHCFDESSVCALLPELIESGRLNKGHWYLLYTRSCVVCVFWFGGDREWRVDAWRRGGLRWFAGLRVLSPAN